MLWSRLPPILWYYGWELLNDLSLLDPLVAASVIEDLVGILYNEHNVRQICVCQTRNRENQENGKWKMENDAAFTVEPGQAFPSRR